MQKKVIVAGHICLDITPAFPETGKKLISEVLLPGKLIETRGVSVSTGGAVANTGLAMKFFGADVKLMKLSIMVGIFSSNKKLPMLPPDPCTGIRNTVYA